MRTANTPNPDYLYRLARSGTSEDRETLARSITSLLHADLTKGEMFLAQDILLHMLREASNDLRQTLALHLSSEEKCPIALIDYLVYECTLDISRPVIKNSPVIDDDYLIDVAKRFDMPEYWHVIADRPKVSKKLALFLIGTDDNDVYNILVKNQGSEFCSLCMNWLTGIAMNVPEIQAPLLQRKEVTPELAAKLYAYVSEELRKEILEKFEIDPAVIDRVMKQVVDRRIEQKSGSHGITPEMISMVQRLPKITSRQIMDSMQRGDRALFACMCGSYLKTQPEKIMLRLEEKPMIVLAVLCRAIGMTRAEYNSLFLMWRRAQGGAAVTNAQELSHAMSIFDQMKPEQAKAEVQSWSNTTHSDATH